MSKQNLTQRRLPRFRWTFLVLVQFLVASTLFAERAWCDLHEASKNAPKSVGVPLKTEIKAAHSIQAKSILKTIEVLSSDSFEGRSPGTIGEEKTVHHLIEQFKKLGLTPGNPDGTYFQSVPIVGAVADYRASFDGKSGRTNLTANNDVVAFSNEPVSDVSVKDSELVFVGYGVVAPEYGWDDYKDIDVHGKTILMLINDPQIPDPKNPKLLDSSMFKGRAMTYYGRWTYKYEIAAQKGAAAAIIIHDTALAGYPFATVINSHGQENFFTASSNTTTRRVPIEAWLADAKTREVLKAAGQDLESLKQAALSPGFRPIPLGTRFNIDMKRTQRKVVSRNVIAKVVGRDDQKDPRYLLYSAHWDHFGRDPKLKGDQIFHGAYDNASGVAGLLEIAKAFTRLPKKPKSTVVFIASTGEERDLLGAKYYVDHPLYPISRTLADLNFDGLSMWGKTRDLELVAPGSVSMEDSLQTLLQESGRVLVPEALPEKGLYYRADQFEFSRAGIPSLWYRPGSEVVGQPKEYGAQRRADYTEHDYHQVTDVIKPDWDLSGSVEDLRTFFRLGYDIAQSAGWPTWKPSGEFKAKRDESASDRP